MRSYTFYRNGGGVVTLKKLPYNEPAQWPQYLPPFLDSAATFAPDGNLWVRRTTRPGEPPLYDVVDQTGRIRERISLRPRSRVIGFGKSGVYVIRPDDDDLEHLERYPLPRSR